ncbi:neuronal acetylcholine receptor subunit beta-3 [Strongylocentrotus purpuratus]|uniref:Neurotransmitter-gated ion-channel transmembrane domain-containing protein n=1 Tax=Strongylocentrotus purpuratus TaxID=7668 RepID=A0A7M7PGL4_STRPU|nr:neuronal acetylcholine receptor subunit beta-3 [Strongylocentrotus purpuratus]
MKIHKFPFDEQECWLRFTMQNTPIHLVRVDSSSVQVVDGRRDVSSEWDIISTYTLSEFVSIPRNITYEMVGMCFKLRRLPRYYIDNVTSPIAILSWLSIIIFIIPAKSGERLSAAISLVLGLTVFQIVVTDNLPKNSRGDAAVVTEYVSDCFIITIVVTVMSAIVINLSHREGEINNKFIRSVFFNHLGPWCFLGGGRCGGKKAQGSNPNESCKAGGLEMKDSAAQTRSSDGHTLSQYDVWVKRQSTNRFDEQDKTESPKIHDFELLARIMDRLFLFATLVSLTAITVKFLMEM